MSAPSLSTGLASPWSEASASSHEASRARDEAELHAARRRSAVRVIAGAAKDVADARDLLAMLGLGVDDVLAARPARAAQLDAAQLDAAQAAEPVAKPPKRSRKARAA